MVRASRTFRPPWWATAGTLLGCAAFCTAGLWQLDRAGEKDTMFRDFRGSELAEVLTEPIADDALAESWYRPMRLTGHYDAEHQLLLDMMVAKHPRDRYQSAEALLEDILVARRESAEA